MGYSSSNPNRWCGVFPLTDRQVMYGGQAVIEGVMIRGGRTYSVAARGLDGSISTTTWPVPNWNQSRWRKIPLLRGTLVLAETLTNGMRALAWSTRVSMGEEVGSSALGSWTIAFTLIISLGIAIVLFFIFPLLIVESGIDPYTGSSLLSNLAEGAFRLLIFLIYLIVIGYIPNIRRVFGYHAAEHMAVHTYEARQPLEKDAVRNFPAAHPRCGTAFLLTVMLVSILVFAVIGKPDLPLRIASRVILIPVIAGISYEVIRFNARHHTNRLVQLFAAPSLLMQKLTTRTPDDGQIEVAIHAMNVAITGDRNDAASNQLGKH